MELCAPGHSQDEQSPAHPPPDSHLPSQGSLHGSGLYNEPPKTPDCGTTGCTEIRFPHILSFP